MLIDDNELTLDAFAAPLRRCAGVDLVAAVGHTDALAIESWSDIDVVVLDAADEKRVGDQFPGVGVVRHIRARQGLARPVIAIVTGHFQNDGLRRRMAEVDADFFFHRANLRSVDILTDFVLDPDVYRRAIPPVSGDARDVAPGLTHRSRVDELVSYVERYELEGELMETRTGHGATSRRAWLRHRRALSEIARIDAVNLTTGTSPRSEQRYPSIHQVRRLWLWAARVPKVDDGLSQRTPKSSS